MDQVCSAGRVRSQPERCRAAQQASVACLLAHDSMPKRPMRAAVALQRTVRVQLAGHDLLRRECRCGMILMSVSRMRR